MKKKCIIFFTLDKVIKVILNQTKENQIQCILCSLRPVVSSEIQDFTLMYFLLRNP